MRTTHASKSYRIPLLAGFMVILFIIGKQWSTPAVSVAAQPAIQADAPQTIAHPNDRTPPNRNQEIMKRRRLTAIRLGIHAQTAPVKVLGEKLRVEFRFQPEARSCKDGDLDLLSKVSEPSPKLLLTVHDDSNGVIFSRALRTEDLHRPLPFSVELPKTEKSRFYRLALCSDQGADSCKNSLPFDYETYSRLRAHGKIKMRSKATLLFYSLSFVTKNENMEVMDPFAKAGVSEYSRYVQAIGGAAQQKGFIEENLKQQRKMGVVPLRFVRNTVVLPLYYNDKSLCSASRNGGQAHAK